MDTGSGYTTDTSSISTEPSEKRKVKQRPRKKRQRSSAGPSWGPLESDTKEDWKFRSVSTIWTMSRIKDYGLHYETKHHHFLISMTYLKLVMEKMILDLFFLWKEKKRLC